jgi:hypothetical protein
MLRLSNRLNQDYINPGAGILAVALGPGLDATFGLSITSMYPLVAIDRGNIKHIPWTLYQPLGLMKCRSVRIMASSAP